MVDKVLGDIAKEIAIRPTITITGLAASGCQPVRGQHFDNVSPINGRVICTIARSTAEDVELAHWMPPTRHAKAWGSYLARRNAPIC